MRARKASLPRNRSALLDEFGKADIKTISERHAAYGYRFYWTIRYSCSGCSSSHTPFNHKYLKEEAEAIAAEQNRFAETPESKEEAANWRLRVRGYAEEEVGRFREMLLSRYPDWLPFAKFVTSEEALEAKMRWDCALLVRVPSQNPAVEKPLEIWVSHREVLVSWVDGWHIHVEPRFNEEEEAPLTYLNTALECIEAVVSEKRIVGTQLRQGKITGGFSLTPDGTMPDQWMGVNLEEGDSIRLRSWRGTYDEVIAGGTGTNKV